ncbi:hypothetical protein [Chryseobacterium paludis]|uniref:hypothetical protein n=1 Tax=Chryseobacterium paludis TaxID=2956784 RepID=UPI0021BE643F|nr:hypothetical protein [Chryseobacterium paludis]
MIKDDVKVGNWVYLESNFIPRNPIEVILEVEEADDYFVKCKQVDYPDSKHTAKYEDIMPVDLTESILTKLGFVNLETDLEINDYAGFKLYFYNDLDYAFNNKCLYKFEVKTIMRFGNPLLTVVPIGNCMRYVHELQNR